MTVELRPPDPEAVAEVSRLLAEEGVGTQPPRPGLGQWAAEIGELVRGKLLSAFGWVPGGAVVETIVFVVLGAALALLITFAVLAFLRRRSAVPSQEREPEEIDSPDDRDRPVHGAAHWRARLEHCLAAGDRSGALEALWSWLLSTVAGDVADVRPLAGRRLVREAGRLDLLPLVRRLEAASYGGDPPDASGLRELARGVEGVADGAIAGGLA